MPLAAYVPSCAFVLVPLVLRSAWMWPSARALGSAAARDAGLGVVAGAGSPTPCAAFLEAFDRLSRLALVLLLLALLRRARRDVGGLRHGVAAPPLSFLIAAAAHRLPRSQNHFSSIIDQQHTLAILDLHSQRCQSATLAALAALAVLTPSAFATAAATPPPPAQIFTGRSCILQAVDSPANLTYLPHSAVVRCLLKTLSVYHALQHHSTPSAGTTLQRRRRAAYQGTSGLFQRPATRQFL